MGYGQELPPEPQQQPQLPYPDESDMWAGRTSNDHAAQIRAALFNPRIPKTKEDWENSQELFLSAVDMVARIPGYGSQLYLELTREMEDISDISTQQGRKKILETKMKKFIFKLRALVPKGDVPIAGVTGVTAMITTNSNIKQEVRMPQQQAPSSIFDGAAKLLGRGR
jgi:hypothetical protein